MPETTTDAAAPAAPGARQRPATLFPILLEGKPALVTGTNSGIGKAVALGLAASGADVIVNYIVNSAAAEEVAHQIEAGGRRALAIKADVSREEEVQAMFAKAVDHFGTLHIAVNNVNRPFNCGLMSSSLFLLKPFGKAVALGPSERASCEEGRARLANG